MHAATLLGRLPDRGRDWAVAFLGTIILGVYASTPLLGASGPAIAAGLRVGGPWLAVGWVLYRARRGTAGDRFWRALAAGLGSWAAAGLAQEPAVAARLPAGALISTALFIAASACWIYALAQVPRAPHARVSFALITDALLVVVCGVTLSGYFVLGPAVTRGGGLLAAHAIAGLLLFAALVIGRYSARRPLAPDRALALAGLLVVLLGDGWQLWEQAGAGAPAAPVLGFSRILAGLIFMGAAGRTGISPASDPPASRWEAVAPWLPMASLAAVFALPVLHYAGRPLGDAVLFGVFLSLALAFVRLGLSLRENHDLRQERGRLLWQNEEYARLAISDPLTGLFNKGYFAHRLRAEFESSQRYHQPLTVIALDLDNFKAVNDQFGHAAGDALLRAIGQALRAGSRSTDIACRCGGDEFTVILPHTHIAVARPLAERLRAAVADAVQRQGLG
ncbi:MAG TPA: GGDEF domain-containing protein, partial [Chloroflexia bacterium]|nr:GGDEF domain-containing protein [Chloroflexia bacterium]